MTKKRTERPWGHYEVIEEGCGYIVKILVVQPGKSLSYQMHHHRSEHWVVVQGTAKVRIGDKETLLRQNESLYIPATEWHQLSNPGKIDLRIVEVQTGEYIDESDIVREPANVYDV